MLPSLLYYHVLPHEHLPGGMRPVTLTVLSPVWQGPEVTVVYPDGWEQTLLGWTAGGSVCGVKLFWTQAPEGGPTVCLAIGGDGWVRVWERAKGIRHYLPPGPARPFLALAASLIPASVATVIGPAPPRTPLLVL